MTSLPEDVRVALGTPPPEGDWARIRSSPGSVVGETYLFLRPKPLALTRASALDPLQAIDLDGPPTLEEAEFDAWVLLPSGGNIVKLAVGYLDRDAVRALFEPPVAEPAPTPEPTVTAAASSPELTEVRGVLVDRLAERARARAAPVDRGRSRFLRLLRLRPQAKARHRPPPAAPHPERAKKRVPQAAPVEAREEEAPASPISAPSAEGAKTGAFKWIVIGFVLAAIAWTLLSR